MTQLVEDHQGLNEYSYKHGIIRLLKLSTMEIFSSLRLGCLNACMSDSLSLEAAPAVACGPWLL